MSLLQTGRARGRFLIGIPILAVVGLSIAAPACAQQTPAQLLRNAQTLQPAQAAPPAAAAAAPAAAFSSPGVAAPTFSSPPAAAPAAAAAPSAPEGTLTSSAGCEADLQGLQNKYQTLVGELNKLVAKNSKKLDPVASCPKLKNLVAVDNQVVGYMQKNQSWCGIPDEVLDQVRGRRSKDQSYATQACNFAVEMRRAQSQQAAGAAPPQQRLPAGPL